MIHCYLKGGLGNMFFQIAATESFAIDAKTYASYPNLDTHLNYLNSDNRHNPSLKHSLTYKEILPGLSSMAPLDFKLNTISFPFTYKKINVSDHNIVDGFFQSEKYFVHNRDVVLMKLGPQKHITEVIDNKYGELLKERTTSIHIRRGDYVNHPNHHPTQTIEYYHQAVELLKEKTDKFLIFSDDINWCKSNLNIDNSVYIDNEKDYIEIYLMARCDNNIIANSSFSWWGAWLNTNENKIVVGPKNWLGSAIKENTEDIIPETWVKI
tara:strand:+ start:162 stop:962 length:801 start_codon:yes stop_codon:yes gene_type:complete